MHYGPSQQFTMISSLFVEESLKGTNLKAHFDQLKLGPNDLALELANQILDEVGINRISASGGFITTPVLQGIINARAGWNITYGVGVKNHSSWKNKLSRVPSKPYVVSGDSEVQKEAARMKWLTFLASGSSLFRALAGPNLQKALKFDVKKKRGRQEERHQDEDEKQPSVPKPTTTTLRPGAVGSSNALIMKHLAKDPTKKGSLTQDLLAFIHAPETVSALVSEDEGQIRAVMKKTFYSMWYARFHKDINPADWFLKSRWEDPSKSEYGKKHPKRRA